MGQLNYEGQLYFNEIKRRLPDIIIQEKIDELREATKGYIVGHVNSYDGHIESYNQKNPFAMLTAAISSNEYIDIQKELGEIGYEKFKFEFFVSSPYLESYKFRILFFEYGISGYPVKVVIEQGIIDEIVGDNSNYIVEINSEVDFNNLLDGILKSKRMITIMQDMINATNTIGKIEG